MFIITLLETYLKVSKSMKRQPKRLFKPTKRRK